MLNCIEDVFHGFYQQNGRLDVAGRCLFLRVFISLLAFFATAFISRNLILSIVIAIIVGAAVWLILLRITLSPIILTTSGQAGTDSEWFSKDELSLKQVFSLLKICFPLFLGTLLSVYIINAPKYTIDLTLGAVPQAIFSFIFSPNFVIVMLSTLIFNPVVRNLSLHWNDKELKSFWRIVRQQLLIIVVLTILCLIAGYLVGIPVLSIIYNTDLSQYKNEFLVLLLGGGTWAAATFIVILITVIRKQNLVYIGYGIVAVLTFLLTPFMIKELGIMGGSIVYLFSSVMLLVMLGMLFVIGFRHSGSPKSSD
jgi:O-antigen/teichoic acid export membrane protein